MLGQWFVGAIGRVAVVFHRLGFVEGEFLNHLVVNLLVIVDVATIVNHCVVELAGRDVVLLENIGVRLDDALTVAVGTGTAERQIAVGEVDIDKHIDQLILLNLGTRALAAAARLRHHEYH